MHEIKATDLTALRQIFAERDARDTELLLDRLDADTRATFESALPVEWHPAETICRLHTAAAEVLFPDDRAALTRLGQELALRTFSTVYRMLLALPTFSFIVRRAPVVWSWYHRAGKCSIEERQGTSLLVVVRGAPELPSPLADVISGHILALGQVTKTKNVSVRVESRNPEAWSWRITWNP